MLTHFKDPCIHCGTALENMEPSECKGDMRKAVVLGWAVLQSRWDGVQHYRYRTSDNVVHELHSHISNHEPYFHFGRSDELIESPPYDERLKYVGQHKATDLRQETKP